MFELLSRVLGRQEGRDSRTYARERLRLVLIHDRVNISPYLMSHLRDDIQEVISRYMVVDTEHMNVTLDRREKDVALLTNIPVKKIRRDYMDKREAAASPAE